MKQSICFIGCLFLLFTFLSLNDVNAAMTDYCVVPPYVIQDVPPNVMIILDNSGSMFNLAYACTKASVASSGTATTVIPVDNVSGFKPRQWIALMHGSTTYQLQITSDGVNAVNNTITVTVSVAAFSIGDAVWDWGCYSGNFYDDSYTCASTQASSAGTFCYFNPC